MAMGRERATAVRLGDGRVLVVGNEFWFSRDDSVKAEVWDPNASAWSATGSLPTPRSRFAAAPLADGRVLVVGGLNQDADVDHCTGAQGSPQSFSSSYIYDPASGSWVKTGLLSVARTAPAAALLPDGRVLVAGGYYDYAPAQGGSFLGSGVDLPTTDDAGAAILVDVDVPPIGYALATAELYDPRTGTWSDAEPMRYARAGAVATTLADGRVLIVGSGTANLDRLDVAAYASAEIYDPATGRFSSAGNLPPIDPDVLASFGLGPELDTDMWVIDVGTLVPLNDGGAVLIGQGGWWKHTADMVRSLRFDARSGEWTEIGQTWIATEAGLTTPGTPRLDASVAVLPDGRVLVAGGTATQDSGYGIRAVTSSVEAYDPTNDSWSPLPSMPDARAGGAVVSLVDGSVLVVGGYHQHDPGDFVDCDDPTGLDSALRFVPAR